MNQFKNFRVTVAIFLLATVTRKFLGSTSTSPSPDYFQLGTHSAFLAYSVNFIVVSLRNIAKLTF